MLHAKLLLAFLCIVFVACKRVEPFPDLGTKVASPVDVEVSENGNHFFVLNADFDRTYGQGSILVLDKDGGKVTAVPVPRMGRFLTLAGNDLFVGIDAPDEETQPMLLLFDMSDPQNPVERKRWSMECSPLNAAVRSGYDYFVVSCTTGQIYLGKLAEDRVQSTMKVVRRYGVSRRALHIDPVRGLVFGFTTDLDKQSNVDSLEVDKQTYDEQGKLVEAPLQSDGSPSIMPDEIPDERQSTRRALSNRNAWQTYQFFVYNINQELGSSPSCTSPQEGNEDCFPYRKVNDPVVLRELRWMYFQLSNIDGSPDPVGPEFNPSTYKYYRTNFWAARHDRSDPDVFYLSHRGPPRDAGSPHANQIIRVRITGDIAAETVSNPGTTTSVPKTGDVLQFERIYGFAGPEVSKYHYPGDFELTDINGQDVLVVNHFRDLVNWVRGDVYFSIAAKTLDGGSWLAETENPDTGRADPGSRSWYQVAVNREGRAVSCLFYSNAVMLLDVVPGVGITEVKRIQ